MKRDMAAMRQCVQDLVAGDFANQAREGDTIGVWTYDSELHAGIFPMQEWSEDSDTDIAKHLDDFLKQQRCKGDAHFDLVMAGLNRVVTDSDSVTILIFSDGYAPIQGTPFDASINDVYAQHRVELHDAHIPFVTLLQASKGKIVRGTVNSAVGPIDIPAPPAPPAPPQPVEAPAPAPPPVVIVKTNAPLILDYSQASRAQGAPVVNSGNPATAVAPYGQTPAAPGNNASPAPGLLASTLSAITNLVNLGQSSATPQPPPVTAAGVAAGTQPALAQTAPAPAGAGSSSPGWDFCWRSAGWRCCFSGGRARPRAQASSPNRSTRQKNSF
jgi:hypothetical protein